MVARLDMGYVALVWDRCAEDWQLVGRGTEAECREMADRQCDVAVVVTVQAWAGMGA